MKKLIISGALGSASSVRMAHLRAGLPPELSEELGVFPAHGTSGTNAQRLAVSPDQTKIVSTVGSANSPQSMSYYAPPTEDLTFTEAFTHGASFSGRVYCCATNNSLRVYGGESPFLYVLDWTSGDLLTVSTAGLGQVNAIAFSPDGSRLAVCHNATPFLRIYDVADWSYVNAATAFQAAATDVCWTPDSEKIIAAATSSSVGSLTIYSKAGVRLFLSTSQQAYGTRSVHPLVGENAVIFAGSSQTAPGPAPRIRKIDLSTLSVTTVAEGSAAAGSMCVDEVAGRGYVVHAAMSGRYISEFPLAGGELAPTSPTLAALVVNDSACLKLLVKDTGRVVGTVRDLENLPAQRTILAYERVSGRLSGKTTSDAVTGNYTLDLPNTREHDLVFQAQPGEQLNDLFFARVEPQAV